MWRGAAVQALSGALRGKQGNFQLPTLPLALQQRRQFADASSLKKTVLYDYHVEHGGKMVPFAGYSMPIQYKDSIIDSTTNCRTNGSLFDVSHMCGLSLKGKDAIPFLETLVVGDIASLKPGTGSLSVITNELGGIIDDTVVTKVDDSHIYLVVNAGCREKDLGDSYDVDSQSSPLLLRQILMAWSVQSSAAHFEKHMSTFKARGKDVSWHIYDERSLLALQGPLAAPALQKLTAEDLSKMYFSDFKTVTIAGVPCFLTRTGYTGEDGFEISIPSEHTLDLTKKILEASEDKIRLTGLGARDSLRLEAGLCLYGNDLDETITPVEAGLNWTIGKRRRAEGGFLGSDVILKQLADGPTKRRIGLVSIGAPARSHVKILNEAGEEVGEVTSGGFSPCLKKNISMGYVKSGLHKSGTAVKVDVRGKINDATITKMPFVPTKYYKAV